MSLADFRELSEMVVFTGCCELITLVTSSGIQARADCLLVLFFPRVRHLHSFSQRTQPRGLLLEGRHTSHPVEPHGTVEVPQIQFSG